MVECADCDCHKEAQWFLPGRYDKYNRSVLDSQVFCDECFPEKVHGPARNLFVPLWAIEIIDEHEIRLCWVCGDAADFVVNDNIDWQAGKQFICREHFQRIMKMRTFINNFFMPIGTVEIKSESKAGYWLTRKLRKLLYYEKT